MAQEIAITDGIVIMYAELNDTVAAEDFAGRLPCTFAGCDYGEDYCFQVACGRYDPMEMQTGWKNGDLCLSGCWLSILYGGEEHSATHRDMMIIGHLDEESLKAVQKMPEKVNLYFEIV